MMRVMSPRDDGGIDYTNGSVGGKWQKKIRVEGGVTYVYGVVVTVVE